MTAEETRLAESRAHRAHWNRWGPYVAERAWGTVREDYSPGGTAWDYFPHDHARSRAYRWNEDGLAGVCDRHQHICLAVALWNERDPILKERLFGLNANEGNHGEDVKEYYFYADNTPTHAYMRYVYKYPHAAFPYEALVEENRRRTKQAREFELLDTGVFNEQRYFDVVIEYAKATTEDLVMRITVHNRGPEAATVRVLPTIWFRNRWSWGHPGITKPKLWKAELPGQVIEASESSYGTRYLICDGSPDLLFTENETNTRRLFGDEHGARYVKDSINDYVVHGDHGAVNPAKTGTKAAAHYTLTIPAGASSVIRVRFTDSLPGDFKTAPLGGDFDQVFATRQREADEYYATIVPKELTADAALVMRQGLAGLLWSKQFYHYIVRDWLNGDPGQPSPPPERRLGRNHEWIELYNSDVLSMPDKWEYPWYAA